MNKILKIITITFSIFIILFLISASVMFFRGFCPPQGPWPNPPWCESNANAEPWGYGGISNSPAITGNKTIQVNFTLTVPYWTTGDVYLGIANNPAYLKMTKYNQIIYTLTTSLNGSSEYYYTNNGKTEISPMNRKIISSRTNDYVLDWQNSGQVSSKPFASDFQKSFYIGACYNCDVSIRKGNFIEPMTKAMDEIKTEGANWVNFVPAWFIVPDYRGNGLMPIYAENFKGATGWVGPTIKDEDLITLIKNAHEKGLKIYLVPHVAPENWGPGIKGKGDLEPNNPDEFFKNYTAFINHYADIAQQYNVEMFGIGNEMDTLTQEDLQQNSQIDKTAKWRELIKSVRQHYKGKLTYSVSCITERRCGPELIKFWDDLDVIGWEWYTPIANSTHESIESMRVNADRIVQTKMKVLSEKYNKPIVLTELGWEAYSGACAHTYADSSVTAKVSDRKEQSSCYEAIFQAIQGQSFIIGTQIWTWDAGLPTTSFEWVNKDTSGEIRNSITEDEIAKWFNK